MTEYEFHPLADQYPLMSDADLQALADDISEHGQLSPVVLLDGKILDGRNRYLACRLVGFDAMVENLPDGADPVAWVESANEHRRHLTPSFVAQRRAERVARVAEKRKEGKSLRVIAEEEGVSEKQVRKDIVVASTADQSAVEPPDGKVTGKDGKKREASKPKKPEPWDEETTSESPKSSSNGKPVKPLRDGKGLPVPESLRATWESLDEFDRLKRVLEQVERDISTLAKGPGGEFLAENLQGAKNDTYTCDRVRKVLLLLKTNRPWLSRCPECLGQKRKDSSKRCVSCKDLGWITADTYGRADMAGTRAIDKLVAEQEESADE